MQTTALALLLSLNVIIAIQGKIDLNQLENEQQLLIQNLNKAKTDAADLKEKLETLKPTRDDQSLSVSNSVAPIDAKQDENDKEKIIYTPPIIILLPEESTFRDKWEYAVTLKCLGQKDFSAFQQVHNSRMAEMMTIRGKSVDEINHEIKNTKKELESSRKEYEKLRKETEEFQPKNDRDKTRLLHMKHNLKLLNREIDAFQTKLTRLDKRLKSAILFSKSNKGKHLKSDEDESEDGQGQGGDGEDEEVQGAEKDYGEDDDNVNEYADGQEDDEGDENGDF